MATSKKPAAIEPAAKPAAEARPAAKKAPATKKPTAKATVKPAAKAVPKAKVPAKKTPAPKGTAAVMAAGKAVTPEQRANYIEVAAFYIAERRGFAPGNPEQDYLDAAAEIDRLIAAGHFSK